VTLTFYRSSHHIQFFVLNLKKMTVTLIVGLLPGISFAQQSCAQIAPPNLRSVDKPYVIYDHYIKPIQTSLSIGKAIILPYDIAGKAKFLMSLQREYMSYGEATAIDLVSTIKRSYALADLKTLNTEVVLNILKLDKNDSVAEHLKKTAMCVGPSLGSTVKFEINFYALNNGACKKMHHLFKPATSPDEVRVNNEINGKCLSDGIGKNDARNQITFIYLKGAH